MTRRIALAAGLFLALAYPGAVSASTKTLPMIVTVHPNPMRSDTRHEYVQVVTQPRIVCVAFVLYDNGTLPLSFAHAETQVTSYRGEAIWSWHETTTAHGGTASVSCNNSLLTRTVNVRFQVLPATTSHPAPATPTPTRNLAVRVVVSPNPMPRDTFQAQLTAYTTNGARCVAGLFDNNGWTLPSFAGIPQTVSGGSVTWHWHEDTVSTGGTATVTCTYQGKAATATATFTVKS